jgi:hypothetical protein
LKDEVIDINIMELDGVWTVNKNERLKKFRLDEISFVVPDVNDRNTFLLVTQNC